MENNNYVFTISVCKNNQTNPYLCGNLTFAFAAHFRNLFWFVNLSFLKSPNCGSKVTSNSKQCIPLQILLAIGGWAFGSTPFKELTSNVFRMNQFVYEAIEFLRDYQFNGLDVDWEYPR